MNYEQNMKIHDKTVNECTASCVADRSHRPPPYKQNADRCGAECAWKNRNQYYFDNDLRLGGNRPELVQFKEMMADPMGNGSSVVGSVPTRELRQGNGAKLPETKENWRHHNRAWMGWRRPWVRGYGYGAWNYEPYSGETKDAHSVEGYWEGRNRTPYYAGRPWNGYLPYYRDPYGYLGNPAGYGIESCVCGGVGCSRCVYKKWRGYTDGCSKCENRDYSCGDQGCRCSGDWW